MCLISSLNVTEGFRPPNQQVSCLPHTIGEVLDPLSRQGWSGQSKPFRKPLSVLIQLFRSGRSAGTDVLLDSKELILLLADVLVGKYIASLFNHFFQVMDLSFGQG